MKLRSLAAPIVLHFFHLQVRETIQTATVPEEDVKAAILESWNNNRYHVEPHTAVGVAVALNPEK